MCTNGCTFVCTYATIRYINKATKKRTVRGLYLLQCASLEAGVGFEPTNVGFANRCLRPLGYPALSGVRGDYTEGGELSQAKN